jgi:hypothetical protein
LFTSGTLGRFSSTLNEVKQYQTSEQLVQIQTAAD